MHKRDKPKPGLIAWLQRFIEADRKKWGGMSLGAHFRLGLAELREIFSLGGNVAQPTPLGMFGTVTPGEVAASRQDDPIVPQLDQETHRASVNLLSPAEIAALAADPAWLDRHASLSLIDLADESLLHHSEPTHGHEHPRRM
jgi:hypothetical protein